MRTVATEVATMTCQDEQTQRQEWGMSADGVNYSVQLLDWNDMHTQTAYQRLRGEVFVRDRGWDLPLDGEGRECDRYDVGGGLAIKTYVATAEVEGRAKELLGGVRVFQLRHWDDSMLRHEFRAAKMIPREVLDDLESRFAAPTFVELTRLCVRSPRLRNGSEYDGLATPSYDLRIARDLVYAGAYAGAEAEGRRYALGVTDGLYLRVMRRSHFVFDTLFDGGMHKRGGYGLVLIDLMATVRAIHACGETARARRMLLCCGQQWL